MRTQSFVRRSATLLIAGLGLAVCAAAVAQVPVTVRASNLAARVIGTTTAGAPLVLTTLKRGVSYSDLDLRTPAGALGLERRVHGTARDLCGQLDDMFPFEQPMARSCTAKAVADAMRQVRLAIGAARSREKSG